MTLTHYDDPAFYGYQTLYQTNDNKLVWKDLYTEIQKFYYIHFHLNKILKDDINSNVHKMYDFYKNYLNLSVGEFDIDSDIAFITDHDWSYYDKIYDKGKLLKVNPALQQAFNFYLNHKKDLHDIRDNVKFVQNNETGEILIYRDNYIVAEKDIDKQRLFYNYIDQITNSLKQVPDDIQNIILTAALVANNVDSIPLTENQNLALEELKKPSIPSIPKKIITNSFDAINIILFNKLIDTIKNNSIDTLTINDIIKLKTDKDLTIPIKINMNDFINTSDLLNTKNKALLLINQDIPYYMLDDESIKRFKEYSNVVDVYKEYNFSIDFDMLSKLYLIIRQIFSLEELKLLFKDIDVKENFIKLLVTKEINKIDASEENKTILRNILNFINIPKNKTVKQIAEYLNKEGKQKITKIINRS